MAKNNLCYAAGCHRPLPKNRKKYCSDRCSNRINMQKKRARKLGVEWEQEEDTLSTYMRMSSKLETKLTSSSMRES